MERLRIFEQIEKLGEEHPDLYAAIGQWAMLRYKATIIPGAGHESAAAEVRDWWERKDLPFPWNLKPGDEVFHRVAATDEDGDRLETVFIKVKDVEISEVDERLIKLTADTGRVYECYAEELALE